jgi:hypothetical protein
VRDACLPVLGADIVVDGAYTGLGVVLRLAFCCPIGRFTGFVQVDLLPALNRLYQLVLGCILLVVGV